MFFKRIQTVKIISSFLKNLFRMCNANGVTPARAAAENEHINVYMVLHKKGAA